MISLFKLGLAAAALAALTLPASAQQPVRILGQSSLCRYDMAGQKVGEQPPAGSSDDLQDTAINIETGKVALSGYGPGWLSAQWTMQPAGADQYKFVNVWTGQLLAGWADGKKKVLGVVANDGSAPMGAETVFTVKQPKDEKRTMFPAKARVAMQTSLITQAHGSETWKLAYSGCEATFAFGDLYWVIETVGAPRPEAGPETYQRLEVSGGRVLNIESGSPMVTKAEAGFFSAMWVWESISSDRENGFVVALRNRWTNKYLGHSGKSVVMVDGPAAGAPPPADPKSVPWTWAAGSGGGMQSFKNIQTGMFLNVDGDTAVLANSSDYIWTGRPAQ